MTKFVCFDLWETLVTEPATFEYCWDPFAKAYSDKIAWPKMHELIAQILQRKDQPTKRSVTEILGNFGVTDEGLVLEISRRWEHSCDQVELFPDTDEALRNLREAGFKLGLITNTSRYGWEAVNKKFLLDSYFDYLALSFKLGFVKPDPKIFEFIERTAGLPANEITMVGDSYRSDFLAPRERGLGSILLDRFGVNKYPEAKPVVRNLLELKAVLQ